MKPEMLALIGVVVVGFIAVGMPYLKAQEDKKAKMEQDKRDAAKQDAQQGIMVGIGSFLTNGGALAGSSANIMDKISDLIG